MAKQNGARERRVFRLARVWRRPAQGRALVIATLALLGALAGVVIVMVSSTTYAASALVQVDPTETSVTNPGVDLDEQEMSTQTVVVEARPVTASVIEDLGLELSNESLERTITAQQVGDSRVMRVTVTWNSPDGAALVANAVADQYLEFRDDQRDERLGSIGFLGSDVRGAPGGYVLSPAVADNTPTGLSPLSTILLSAAFGGLLGIVLIYAWLAIRRGGQRRA